MTLKISNKGWVVIPAELRKKYKLEPGTDVHVVDYGGVLSLVPEWEDPIEHAHAMLKEGPSLVSALLNEHKQELAGGK